MKLKSYFASTVEAAMAMAAKEMGEDAMLVYSREATAETRYLGKFEVVFAEQQSAGEAPAAPGVAAPASPREVAGAAARPETGARLEASRWKTVEDHIERLRVQLEQQSERIETLLSQTRAGEGARSGQPRTEPAGEESRDRAERVRSALSAADIPMEWCREIAAACAARGRGGAAGEAPVPELAARISARAGIAGDANAKGLVIVIGPPGAGKTSLAVKMAGRRILAGGSRPVLVSVGESRVAEGRELEAYARLIGADYAPVADPVHWRPPADRAVFVDSPAYDGSPGNGEGIARLEALIASHAADIHLVLPASMRTADLGAMTGRFGRFRPTHLAFTRLDETSTYGPVWAIAKQTGMPVSFLSAGRRIPEDLSVAGAAGIARLVAGQGEWPGSRPLARAAGQA